jgi:hypothetical protein
LNASRIGSSENHFIQNFLQQEIVPSICKLRCDGGAHGLLLHHAAHQLQCTSWSLGCLYQFQPFADPPPPLLPLHPPSFFIDGVADTGDDVAAVALSALPRQRKLMLASVWTLNYMSEGQVSCADVSNFSARALSLPLNVWVQTHVYCCGCVLLEDQSFT